MRQDLHPIIASEAPKDIAELEALAQVTGEARCVRNQFIEGLS